MKKVFIIVIVLLQFVIANAGGIMTNTNQSASYIRMLARDASLDLDATYYNPAGLSLMKEGFYISLSNQTIFQTRKIENEFPTLNNGEYTGRVFAPFFPSFYAVYKMEKLAISGGFMFVGGGGGATYKRGLPGFETGVSAIPSVLTGLGIPTTDYVVDIFFEGTSLYMGAQLGLSYQLFDFLGVYGGARYVMANNSYNGYFRNLLINPDHATGNPSGGYIKATNFFENIGDLEAAAITADKEVNVKQTGAGFTPVIGFNYSPTKELNIGLKYEFKTKLELVNETKVDETFTFPDEEKTRQDMPAMISLGASYKILPELTLAIGGHYYFDRLADYGKLKERTPFPDLQPTFYKNSEIIDANFFEAALGLEYALSDDAFVSMGYLRAQSGVNNKYQSDMSHSLTSNSIGLGTAFKFARRGTLNVGALLTFYDEAEKSIDYGNELSGEILFNENYNRSALVFAIGLDIRLSR